MLRTARALFRGPLTGTAQALTNGELSAAHAQVLAAGTHDLPAHTTAEAEPVAGGGGPAAGPAAAAAGHHAICGWSPTPTAPSDQAERRYQQRGLWLASTWEGMVAVNGLLEPEAGQTLLAALEPWPAPPTPTTTAAAASAGPMPWPSWPAAAWKPASCPRPAGCDPSCW